MQLQITCFRKPSGFQQVTLRNHYEKILTAKLKAHEDGKAYPEET